METPRGGFPPGVPPDKLADPYSRSNKNGTLTSRFISEDQLCMTCQGRQKLPQSGWARPKIIPLVVKSGWAHVPFQ